MQVPRSTLDAASLLLFALGLAQLAAALPQQQQQQQQQQQVPLAGLDPKASQLQQPQQQQQIAAGAQLQAQLSQLQQQAQRQLNGLVLNAVNSTKYSNVLEAISNVGKAIHQQISQAANPAHVNIMTSSASSSGASSSLGSEAANSKKNEYQSIVTTDQGSSLQPPLVSGASNSSAQYREQGELLRQEIVRRAGQLQQVVAGSMELLKNNGDLIVRRLLEQMNVRLDQAKAKADKIINEPTTNEVALRALGTINLGLNNLNTIIANIVNRLDQANRETQLAAQGGQQQQAAAAAATTTTLVGSIQQRGAGSPPQLPQIIDTSRFRANLQQLGQQFQQALNGSSLHQQLALIRAQRLQMQQQQQQQQVHGAAPPVALQKPQQAGQ